MFGKAECKEEIFVKTAQSAKYTNGGGINRFALVNMTNPFGVLKVLKMLS